MRVKKVAMKVCTTQALYIFQKSIQKEKSNRPSSENVDVNFKTIELYKTFFFLFILIFLLYIPFSREPDFFTGKTIPALVHKSVDNNGHRKVAAHFTLNGKDSFSYDPSYLFKNFEDGEKINTIYNAANPSEAAAYAFWGYWIGWKELLALLTGYTALFLIAVFITRNPSDEAIKDLEEAARPKMRKPRYDV